MVARDGSAEEEIKAALETLMEKAERAHLPMVAYLIGLALVDLKAREQGKQPIRSGTSNHPAL